MKEFKNVGKNLFFCLFVIVVFFGINGDGYGQDSGTRSKIPTYFPEPEEAAVSEEEEKKPDLSYFPESEEAAPVEEEEKKVVSPYFSEPEQKPVSEDVPEEEKAPLPADDIEEPEAQVTSKPEGERLPLEETDKGESAVSPPPESRSPYVAPKIKFKDIETAPDGPLQDICFVVDNSGSMIENDPDFITRDVITSFFNALSRESRLGMVVFDQTARLAVGLKAKTEADAEKLWSNRLSTVDYQGQFTNSPAGIERALYELKTNGRKEASKAIVFITDGIIDTGNKQQDIERGKWLKEDLANECKKEGIRIFGVAFTEKADVHLLQKLAKATDGGYYRAFRAEEIPGVCDKIIQVLNEPLAEPGPVSPPVQIIQETPVQQRVQVQPPPPEQPPVVTPVEPPPQEKDTALISDRALIFILLVFIVVLVYLKYFKSDEKRVPAPVLDQSAARSAGAVQPAMDKPADDKTVVKTPVPDASREAEAEASSLPKPEAKLIDVRRASSKGVLPLDLSKDRITIGRGTTNDIVIPHKTISSFHATIEYSDGYFCLEDHRSTNGTSLNSKKLSLNQRVKLKSGDRIDFASFEFRFIMLDRDPVGKTVVLGTSSLLPKVNEPEGEDVNKEDTLKEPERDDYEIFKDCLGKHLQRISDIDSTFKSFVNNHFTEELMNTLAEKSKELMAVSREKKDGHTITLPMSPVIYQLCTLPVEIEDAGPWFLEKHGGFIEYLNGSFNNEYFLEQGFNLLCIIVYGRTSDAWISLTIAPTGENGSDQIEIMSYEFLSEDEKRSLAFNFDEIGRIV